MATREQTNELLNAVDSASTRIPHETNVVFYRPHSLDAKRGDDKLVRMIEDVFGKDNPHVEIGRDFPGHKNRLGSVLVTFTGPAKKEFDALLVQKNGTLEADMQPLFGRLGSAPHFETDELRRATILRGLIVSDTVKGECDRMDVLVPETYLNADDMRQAMVDYLPTLFTSKDQLLHRSVRGLSFGGIIDTRSGPVIEMFLEGDARAQYQAMMRELEIADNRLDEKRTVRR